MAVVRLTQLVPECDDAERLARFWQEVFDLPGPEGDSDWLTLRWEPVGRFSFHRVTGHSPPPWPVSTESSRRTSTSSSTTWAKQACWSNVRVPAR